MMPSGGTAEDFLHHVDQAQRACIADPVIDSIGVLAARQDALVAKDGKMLGYIALRGTHMLDDILHADLPGAQDAEYLQAQGVRHGLERTGGTRDVFFLVHLRLV